MALITRLARLFQADMHAVLDAIEEPALLLKQSIREMEESIAADEKQIRLWECEQRQVAGKRDWLEESLDDLEEKCALCFKSHKDDLARSFIRRKLEAQQAKQLLAGKITALQEKIFRLTDQLTEHQAQLAAMKQKAEIFLEENSVNATHWEYPSVNVRDEDVEVAFLSEKQKWSAS
ncbi:MAG: PspA/IM30 family protein [Methylomicrobium sp.]